LQSSSTELATQIRVFSQSEFYPGLPLVTSLGTNHSMLASLRYCLSTVSNDARFAEVRKPLLINGFSPLELSDYAPCLQMRAVAAARGVSVL
jgi:ABC-type phosphate/phosphonate transport system substrate-binding protein